MVLVVVVVCIKGGSIIGRFFPFDLPRLKRSIFPINYV